MLEVNVDDIERIKRNSNGYKMFLNSPGVEKLLVDVGQRLVPYLDASTGESFAVRSSPSTEPRAGVDVYAKNVNRDVFKNGSIPAGVVKFLSVNGGSLG